MHNSTINDLITRKIRESGSKLVSIRAVTKDGEVKTFVTSHAFSSAPSKQDIVTVSGRQAAETRAANNPTLYNVRDVNKLRELVEKKGLTKKEAYDKCRRSFYLDRALTISANGETIELREYRG